MHPAPLLFRRRPVAPPALAALILAALILTVQLLVIGLVFKHGIAFRCLDNWPPSACQTASRSLAALYCMVAAAGLLVLLRPALFRGLLARAGHDARPLGLNLAGFALAMLPVLFMRQGQGAAMLAPAFAAWTGGMALMLAVCGRTVAIDRLSGPGTPVLVSRLR